MIRALLAFLLLSLSATAQTFQFTVPQQEPNAPPHQLFIPGPLGGSAKYLRLVWTDRNRRTYGFESLSAGATGTFGPNTNRCALGLSPDGSNVIFQAQALFPSVSAASFAPRGGYGAYDGLIDFGGVSGSATAVSIHQTFTENIPFQPALGGGVIALYFTADGDAGTTFTGSGAYATQETCLVSASGVGMWIH